LQYFQHIQKLGH